MAGLSDGVTASVIPPHLWSMSMGVRGAKMEMALQQHTLLDRNHRKTSDVGDLYSLAASRVEER